MDRGHIYSDHSYELQCILLFIRFSSGRKHYWSHGLSNPILRSTPTLLSLIETFYISLPSHWSYWKLDAHWSDWSNIAIHVSIKFGNTVLAKIKCHFSTILVQSRSWKTTTIIIKVFFVILQQWLLSNFFHFREIFDPPDLGESSLFFLIFKLIW